MTYCLVRVDESYHLENPEGEVIAEYDEKPSHPVGTAADVADDIGLSGTEREAFMYIIQRKWGFCSE